MRGYTFILQLSHYGYVLESLLIPRYLNGSHILLNDIGSILWVNSNFSKDIRSFIITNQTLYNGGLCPTHLFIMALLANVIYINCCLYSLYCSLIEGHYNSNRPQEKFELLGLRVMVFMPNLYFFCPCRLSQTVSCASWPWEPDGNKPRVLPCWHTIAVQLRSRIHTGWLQHHHLHRLRPLVL